MDHLLNLYTKSYDTEWNRIVYLKILNENAYHHLNDTQSCKLILFSGGNGLIECNNRMLQVSSPAIICLNHTDTIRIDKNIGFVITVLFFRPTTLNDCLDYTFINQKLYDSYGGTTIYQDLTLLSTFYDISGSKRILIIIDPTSSNALHSLLDRIDAELTHQKDGFWPCRSRSYFIELLFYLEGLRNEKKSYNEEAPIKIHSNTLVYSIINYLYQNINSKITLEMIEKEFACNRNKINNEFKKEMNTSVMNYFVKMRMQLAAGILRDTGIPIMEVSMRVGYSDVGYFSRTFKKQFGQTPNEYQSLFES